MKKNPESIFHTVKEITLDSSVRASMREQLIAYAHMHPVMQKAPVNTFLRVSFFRPALAAFVLVVVVATGTGAAYAAESAVPGDVLYPVKRKVNEPLRVSLATDTQAKARVHTQLAERRLEEATKLAVVSKLDAQTSATLVEEFERSADVSAELADTLETEGEVEGALEVRSDLEARLAAHSQILSLVSELPEQETAVHARTIAERVSNRVSLFALLRAESESVVAAAEPVAEPDQVVVTTSVAIEEPVATTMMMAAEPVLESIETPEVEEIVDEARVLLKEEKPVQAYIRTQEAVRAATEATVLQKNSKLISLIKSRVEEAKKQATSTQSVPTTTPESDLVQ